MSVGNIPLITAPGYGIDPFIPPIEWIQNNINSFLECTYMAPNSVKNLGSGKYSFSLSLYGGYRISAIGCNYGLSAGALCEAFASRIGIETLRERIEDVEVVTCFFDSEVSFVEKDIEAYGQVVRAACVTPVTTVVNSAINSVNDGETLSFNYFWLGKSNLLKAVFCHDRSAWIS